MTDPDTKWQLMARALMSAIFNEPSIDNVQKQAIFDSALRRSPGYAVTGDVSFESMVIADALANRDESELDL